MAKIKTKKIIVPSKVLIFACSGGSNVGQIANNAAIYLTAQNKGKMYCLAGIGGKVDSIILSTKLAKKIVAIDGCSAHCVRKTLEHAGVDVNVHVVVTKQKIKTKPMFFMDYDQINKIVNKVTAQLRYRSK